MLIIFHSDKVKRAEILVAFFLEHNIAFTTIDHLIPLKKKNLYHSIF